MTVAVDDGMLELCADAGCRHAYLLLNYLIHPLQEIARHLNA